MDELSGEGYRLLTSRVLMAALVDARQVRQQRLVRFHTDQTVGPRADFGFYSWPEPLGSDASAYHEIRQAALDREWALAKKVSDQGEMRVNNMTQDREYDQKRRVTTRNMVVNTIRL